MIWLSWQKGLILTFFVVVLKSIELVVEAALLQEVLVRPYFPNHAFVQDDDLVNLVDSRQAMRNDNGSTICHDPTCSLLNQVLSCGIDTGSRFVQYQNARVESERAG